jgi:rhodanese-related sulfurtransferase
MIEVNKIYSKDAWMFLKTDKRAKLVDVRTAEEWELIGRPDLSSIAKKVLFISWLLLPNKDLNANFLLALKSNVQLDDPVLFICKSGGRSAAAAQYAINQGYKNCFNIIDGFEGSGLNADGWIESSLPIAKGRIC